MKSGAASRNPQAGRVRPERLDALFGALSDPIRRAMIARLVQGECSVTTLGEPFPISSPAITKHLDVLQNSGLIVRRKVGRVRYCRLQDAGLRDVGDWVAQQRAFWQQQLDALSRYLEGEQK